MTIKSPVGVGSMVRTPGRFVAKTVMLKPFGNDSVVLSVFALGLSLGSSGILILKPKVIVSHNKAPVIQKIKTLLANIMIAQDSPTGFVVAVTRWRWGSAFCEKWGELWVFMVVHACVGAYRL